MYMVSIYKEKEIIPITDLENTSNAIYSVFRYQQDAKNKTIELRERLKNCGFTWEQCAKTIIEKVTENWDTGVK